MTCENENCANIFTLSVLGEKTQKNENLKGRIFFVHLFWSGNYLLILMIRIFVRLGSTMREIEIKIVGFIKTQKGLLSSGFFQGVFLSRE